MTVERRLATLLQAGTWLATAVIALGLIGDAASWVTAGIAGLIALPAVRVAVMLGAFARARDYRFAAIAAVVLLAIAAGCVLA